MADTSLNVGVPTGPFIDRSTGDISAPWRLFLLVLFRRTGQSVGDSTAAAQAAAITAQTAAGVAQTSANGASAAVLIEAGARVNGDSINATAIAAEATTRGAAITAEAASRTTADNLRAPKLNAVHTGTFSTALLTNAANDAAAAGAGVAVNQFYRNGSIVMQRVV